MPSGYLKFGFLIFLTTTSKIPVNQSCRIAGITLLAIAVDAQWGYSDVDLRIAERRAIPHYIRHGYEYQDIDMKAIMRQRGILPRQSGLNQENSFNRAANSASNKNKTWKSRGKTIAESNHVIPPGENRYYMKKARHFEKFQNDGKLRKKNKL